MTIPISEFLRRIRPHVNGCPEITINDTLIDVLRDTCNNCDLWLNDKQMMVIVNAVEDYELDEPAGAQVGKVLEVTEENGRKFERWMHTGRNKFRCNFQPSEHSALKLWVYTSLIPAYGITELPDDVFTELLNFVPFGVIARLQDIPGNDWFSPDLASKNLMKYRARANELKIKTMAGFTHGTIRAEMRRFV